MAQKFNFNRKKKQPKAVDKIIKGMNEQERKDLLGTLLAVSNQQTIMQVVQPAVEQGYNSAYALLFERFLKDLNEDNKEEKILSMIKYIGDKYLAAQTKKMEIMDKINRGKENLRKENQDAESESVADEV